MTIKFSNYFLTLISFSILFLASFLMIMDNNIYDAGYAVYEQLPQQCKSYFGDNVCDDGPSDCGQYYLAGASLDACNECQTYRDGKIGFDKCAAATQLTDYQKKLMAEYLNSPDKKDILGLQISAEYTQIKAEKISIAVNADFDNSGKVDFKDFLLFSSVFGLKEGEVNYDAKYDLDGDNVIGFKDFLLFAQEFGKEVNKKNVLVLLLNFLDSPALPFTSEKVKEIIFNGQIQKFYQENSYNQMYFSGDVYDWYTLPRNGIENGNCKWPLIGLTDDITDMALSNKINFGKYDLLVVLPNHPCMDGGYEIGTYDIPVGQNKYRIPQALAGSLQYYKEDSSILPNIKWTGLDNILSHEIGHNLGLDHASSLDCGSDGSLYGANCIHKEYGNLFDLMGNGVYALHFNAFHKEKLGWLNSDSFITIKKSGDYTIRPLETNLGIRMAKIQSLNSDYIPFYIEYRRAIGFDSELNNVEIKSNQNGLFVYQPVKYSKIDRVRNYLLDMTPTNYDNSDLRQVTLNKGEVVFQSPEYGITIGPILDVNEEYITFNVDVTQPVCLYHPPLIFNYAPDKPPTLYKPGDRVLIAFIINNRNGIACGTSKFKIDFTGVKDWPIELYSNDKLVDDKIVTLNPEGSTLIYFFINIPLNANYGDYSVKTSVTDIGANVNSIVGMTNFTVDSFAVKTCSEMGGIICSGNQLCDGQTITARDAAQCCTGICKSPAQTAWVIIELYDEQNKLLKDADIHFLDSTKYSGKLGGRLKNDEIDWTADLGIKIDSDGYGINDVKIPEGEYVIVFSGSDNYYLTAQKFTLTKNMQPIKIKLNPKICIDLGGNICNEYQLCSENTIKSGDTDNCCISQCKTDYVDTRIRVIDEDNNPIENAFLGVLKKEYNGRFGDFMMSIHENYFIDFALGITDNEGYIKSQIPADEYVLLIQVLGSVSYLSRIEKIPITKDTQFAAITLKKLKPPACSPYCQSICTKTIDNGPNEKKINLVFISDGFLNDYDFDDFVKDHLAYNGENAKGLFSVEPFKSNKNKFNVYEVFNTNFYGCRHYADCDWNNIDYKAQLIKDACRIGSIDAIVIIKTDSNHAHYGWYGPYHGKPFGFATSSPYSPSITVHELGHAFAGLGDEYWVERTVYPFQASYSSFRHPDNPYYSINKNFVGCRNWCSGRINQQAACYPAYQQWETCVQMYASNPAENGAALLKCWEDADKKSKIEAGITLNECELGVNCRAETNCYFTANEVNSFRHIKNGIMNMGWEYRYGIISEEAIQNIINSKTSFFGISAKKIKTPKNPIIWYDFFEEDKIISGGEINFEAMSTEQKAKVLAKTLELSKKIDSSETAKFEIEMNKELRTPAKIKAKRVMTPELRTIDSIIDLNTNDIKIEKINSELLIEAYLQVSNKH